MGAMGRYIDRLDDAGKDRLVEAQGWCTKTWWDVGGKRCLVGYGHDLRLSSNGCGRWSPEEEDAISKAFCRFDKAYPRWGQRLIRAIKARASKPPVSKLLEQQQQPCATLVLR